MAEASDKEVLSRLQFELSVARAGNEILTHEKAAYKKRALAAEHRLHSFDARVAHRSDHLDRFFAHPCKDKLAALFPNAKEVTETFGAFHAVKQHLPHLRQGDPNVTVLVVGDGHSPRTGALFAMSSAWSVWSIDPVMSQKYRGISPRLQLIDAKIEDAFGWNVSDKRYRCYRCGAAVHDDTPDSHMVPCEHIQRRSKPSEDEVW